MMYLWLGISLLVPFVLWIFKGETVSKSVVEDSLDTLNNKCTRSESSNEESSKHSETINSNN